MIRLVPVATLLAALLGCNESIIYDFSTPPTVAIVLPVNGSSYNEGDLIEFRAKVADDGSVEDLILHWYSDIHGTLEVDGPVDATGDAIFATSLLEEGNHTVTLAVTDGDGETTAAFVQVSVAGVDAAPRIEIVRPTPSEFAYEGEEYLFRAKVVDRQDLPEDLVGSIQSDQIGWVCDLEIDILGVAECEAALPVGDHLLTFEIEDTDGYSGTDSVFFVILSANELDDDNDHWTESQGDCDDNNPTVNPGASEVLNGIDDDCDGDIDEGTADFDDDGDGWSENEGDCNDANAAINPHAQEVCNDGADNNCNNTTNELNAVGCTSYYVDADGDGYGGSAQECICALDSDHTNSSTDCYDGTPNGASAYPGQTAYFEQHRGDGSFDYNCNNTQEKLYTQGYDCGSGCEIGLGDAREGWRSGVPACGVAAEWVTGCHWDWFDCVEDGIQLRTQACK